MLRTRLFILAVATAQIGCSRNGGVCGADLPAIMREVAADDTASNPRGSPARRAVRDSVLHVLEAERKCATEVGKRFWRPALREYLFRDVSYVGGTFPESTAAVFREIEKLETEYLAELWGFAELLASNSAQARVPTAKRSVLVSEMAAAFATERKPIVTALEAHRRFVETAAELYELMASQPDSFRAMRDGLRFSDSSLSERYEEQVSAVNNAHDAAEASLRALDAEQRKSLHWMGLKRPTPPPTP